MSADTHQSPVVDAAARSRALNPSTSFIVQAPAGSGKTALLTRRVLTLLAAVKSPEEILSITFTRKAAAEMRARVVEALTHAATSERPENTFDQEGYDLAAKVLQRDAELDWRLLENPDRLRMSTIDALCSKLAQQLPVTSTLGGIANPVDDASMLYQEAARRCLKVKTNHYRQLLSTVGNRFEQAEKLLAKMLSSRDQWLRYRELFLVEDREVLRSWLEDQLKDLVSKELGQFEKIVKHSGVDHLIKSQLLPLLKSAGSALSVLDLYKPDVKQAHEQFMHLDTLPTLTSDNLLDWQSVLACLFTANLSDFRKSPNRTIGFPTSKADADALGTSVAELKARKEAMTQLIDALRDAPGVKESISTVLTLPQPEYSERQWKLLEELLTELPSLEMTLHQVFVDSGAVDFIEIATRAQTALGSEDAPTDLALAMDLNLNHILVDEFQDTSRSQFELFRKLVAGWQMGDGRTFFVVGDPMQSIYAFRAAEVSLFDAARRFGITDQVPLEPLTLQVNFRSSPDVVNWVNSAFENIFVSSEMADPSVGAISYSPSVANRHESGAVQVHPLLDKTPEDAGTYVAELVQDTLASNEYRENSELRIAILVRSRAAALPIFAALQSKGIPNLSVDMDSLGEQPVVMDLVSLTLALRFPHSRLHWLAVLRAPWCGLGLTDLHVLTENTGHSKSIIALMNDTQRLDELSTEGRRRLVSFLDIVQPAIDRAARSSIVSWVEAIWVQLGGPMLCEQPVQKNAAQRCLNKLYELEAQGDLWQPSLIQRAMDRLFAVTPDDGSAKVHIMTMHKSKGLEFDTVILPGLNRSPRNHDSQLIDWAVMDAQGDGSAALLMAPMTESNASSQEKALGRLVKSLKSSADEQETRRLLYVACTRAVRQLHLVAPVKVPNSGELSPAKRSLLEPLWSSVKNDFEQCQSSNSLADAGNGEEDNSIESTYIPPLVRVASGWQLPEPLSFQPADEVPDLVIEDDSRSVEYLWAGRTARAVGTVVHEQLERFHTSGLPAKADVSSLMPIVQRQLKQHGLQDSLIKEATRSVIEALQNVTEDATGQWLYDSSHTQARAEWALTARAENRTERRVIDRTFIDGTGTRWIVDFKTGNHKGGDLEGFLTKEVERYEPQLRRYAEILSNIEETPVRLGLYFPLLQAFREVSSQ